MQDAAVPVVVRLAGRVDADVGVELDVRVGAHRHRAGDVAVVERGDAGDGERLRAGQAERLGVGLGRELQRQHTHADQVRAVDALERLGDDRPHTQQHRALGRPVPRRAGAVLLAGQDDQRDTGLLVRDRGVVDAGLLAGQVVHREAALYTWYQLVAQPDVGERAA